MCKKQLILYYLSNIKDNYTGELIFSYIKASNINYSKNRNGIFFNLSILDDNKVNDLYNYITSLEKEKDIKIKTNKEYKKVIKSKNNKVVNYKNYDLNDLDKLVLKYSY